jgi:hypothetical protein
MTSTWQAVFQLAGVLIAVGAAAALASQGTISGSDALAVISAATGYGIHASGVALGTSAATPAPPAPKSVTTGAAQRP